MENEPKIRPVLDCVTRWSSTYNMLSTSMKIKNSLLKLSSNSPDLPRLDLSDFNKIETCLKVLELFNDATLDLMGDNKVESSKLYLIVKAIKKELQEFLENPLLNDYSEALIKMSEKFNKYYNGLLDNSVISHIIDPRFKLEFINNENEKTLAKNKFQELYDNYKKKYSTECSQAKSSQGDMSKLSLTQKIVYKSSGINQMENNFDSEINRYLGLNRIDIMTDPMKWWRNNNDSFPILSIIASDYLPLNRTSGASERSFS